MASDQPTDRACAALIRKGDDAGRYCTKPPMRGQNRCGSHGGSAPQSLAAAARRQQEAAAAKAVDTFGLRRDVTAEDALLEELQWTAGHVAWLRDRVQELDQADVVWGTTSETAKRATEFPGVDTTSEAAPNLWLTLYQRERAHLLAVGTAILKAGVDERRVRLAERQGAQLAAAGQRMIVAVATRLDLPPAAVPVLQQEFTTMLRGLVDAQTAIPA